ncbi:hypothetical protein CE91St56_55950 [Lachnospiraceae bacterium]|nr:hypothetical protein CE91St56_55950 [Lachnospiraceae bacterium]GKH44551.1 hypothetical protein CE91St57_55250 [Lachnospiraceae bacterium]
MRKKARDGCRVCARKYIIGVKKEYAGPSGSEVHYESGRTAEIHLGSTENKIFHIGFGIE